MDRKRSLMPPWKSGVVVKDGLCGLMHAAVVQTLCFWGIGCKRI